MAERLIFRKLSSAVKRRIWRHNRDRIGKSEIPRIPALWLGLTLVRRLALLQLVRGWPKLLLLLLQLHLLPLLLHHLKIVACRQRLLALHNLHRKLYVHLFFLVGEGLLSANFLLLLDAHDAVGYPLQLVLQLHLVLART